MEIIKGHELMSSLNCYINLIKYWSQYSEVSVLPPASNQEISRFENRHSTKLPIDFIDYLRTVNGFDKSKNYQDKNGFSFWPIDEMCRASEYDGGECSFDGAENYFIFCDYLDFSWGYAIHVGDIDNGDIVLIGASDGKPQPIAKKFCDFINLYLNDDLQLYPSNT
jgi:hypothetical protein